MRVGRIIRVVPDRQFGFIRADEFRDDVFFHFSVCEDEKAAAEWEAGFEIEFEIDNRVRLEENQLRATIVKPATRPLKASLDDTPDSKMFASHHPKARQKKPSWRKRT